MPRNYYDWLVGAGPLTLLLALVFLFAGGAKLMSAPGMIEEFTQIGMGQWFRYLTGILEAGGALAVLIPRFRFCGALLLALVMMGATVINLGILALPAMALPTIGLMALAITLAWQWRPGGWRHTRWLGAPLPPG
jgi:putative oxidoreductase